MRHDRIIADPDPAALRERVARDWARAFENDRSATMIALERTQVQALNQVARDVLAERGKLSGHEHSFASRKTV